MAEKQKKEENAMINKQENTEFDADSQIKDATTEASNLLGFDENDDAFPSNMFNVEDEFNVEDAIEDDEGENEDERANSADVPAEEQLNWEDFEVVDEDDETIENAKFDEDIIQKTSECDLQQISDDEEDPEPELKSLSLDLSVVSDRNLSDTQSFPSPNVDAQLVTISSAEIDEKTTFDDVNLNEKKDAESTEIDDDSSKKLNHMCKNKIDVVEEIKPVIPVAENRTKPRADAVEEAEIDSDVLEITVSRGEDLEVGQKREQYLTKQEEELVVVEAKPEEKISEERKEFKEEKEKDVTVFEEVVKIESAKRTEPLPQVALFVESLAQLTFDWKKYTCFYCYPCQIFVTSTSAWEEHYSDSNHKKNNLRWKYCHDLFENRKFVNEVSKHQQDLDKRQELIVGLDYVVEICDNFGQPRNWMCHLCNSVLNSYDFVVLHLSSFGHVDNFMEKSDPDLYTPPGRWKKKLSDNVRVVTESVEKQLMDDAKRFAKRKGRGKLKCCNAETCGNSWTELDEGTIEMEEQIIAQEMQRFFSEEQQYDVESSLKSSTQSVANLEYKKMDRKTKDLFIGLQYLLEIWTPSRRVVPVWYCILCDSLVTNWSKHCEVVQHIAAYLKKHYKKYAFDCAVVEANDEEELRNNIIIAKTKVLQLEGYFCRVNSVVQVTKLHGFDSFVAINAIIAKQLVEKYKITIGDPPRQKRQSISGKPAPPAAATKQKPPSRTAPIKRPAKPSATVVKNEKAANNEKKIIMTKKPVVAKTSTQTTQKTPVKPASVAQKQQTSETAKKQTTETAKKQTTEIAKKTTNESYKTRITDAKRRESDKVDTKRRESPRRSSPRKRSVTPKRRSLSPRSKRYRRDSDSSRHRHDYHHHRRDSHHDRRPSPPRHRRPSPPRPPRRISPPRRRITVEERSRGGRRSYDSSPRRYRSRSRSRSGERYPPPKRNDDDYYRDANKYVAIYGAERAPPPPSSLVGEPPAPVVLLSNEDLAKFTDLLLLVGVDLGRQINMGDLDGLREKMGPFIFDRCLATILNPPVPVQQQQPSAPLSPHEIYRESRGRPSSPSRRRHDEHEDYYRRRSQSPSVNRKMSNRNVGRNLPQSAQQISQPLVDPTASILGYFNNRNAVQVSTNNLNAASQQPSVQSMVPNFLTAPPMFNAAAPPPAAFFETNLPPSVGNLWNPMANSGARW